MGVLLAILAAVFWGLGALYVGRSTRWSDAAVAGFWSLVPGLFVMLAVALALGHLSHIGALSATGWLLLAIAGALHFALGRMSYFVGIKQIGAGRGSTLGFTYTMWGPLFALLLLHEPLSPQLVVGTLLVFAGIVVVTKGSR